MEAYYQETGRAGRDGTAATAWLAFGQQDIVKVRQMLSNNAPPEQQRIEQQKFNALLGYCEALQCRRRSLLTYFSEIRDEDCGNCDNCLYPPDIFNATEAAQQALSTIYRTGQIYGSGHIIDILLGNETDKVVSAGHHSLALFGKGGNHSRSEWQSLIRQLLSFGYIAVDIEGYGGLSLTENCRSLLRGEISFSARKPQKSGKKDRSTPRAELETPEDADLFNLLKSVRLELAKAQNIPPYVIFHDRTLLEMVKIRPVTLAEFGELPGVGNHKLEKYGAKFLSALAKASPDHKNETANSV
jgi:ATP-dependent DNA helicase RecQ